MQIAKKILLVEVLEDSCETTKTAVTFSEGLIKSLIIQRARQGMLVNKFLPITYYHGNTILDIFTKIFNAKANKIPFIPVQILKKKQLIKLSTFVCSSYDFAQLFLYQCILFFCQYTDSKAV